MQQLTQKLGSGDMVIQEVPYPQVGKGMVSSPERCHWLLIHTLNCINVPCGTVEVRPATRAGALVKAIFNHL